MIKSLAKNRRASYDYFIKEELEVGIALLGSEVKALRAGGGGLTGSYAVIKTHRKRKRAELFAEAVHIKPYQPSSYINHEPKRSRRLLAHQKEIKKLLRKLEGANTTLIPLELYLKGALVKVRLGLCVGKKKQDKRESLKQAQAKREVQRYLKHTNASAGEGLKGREPH